MISRTCLLFLPVILLAQSQAPPEVDRELRARVNGFYENFLEGSFSPRKAEGFIAEDTKDYFYNAGKKKFLSFRIDKVSYSDDFTKANVTVVGKGTRSIAGHPVVIDEPMDTRWKIEDGKWCWTYSPYEVSSTPMGGKFYPPGVEAPKAAPAIPKDSSPDAIRTAAVAVVRNAPMGIDKASITMSADQPGTAQVVFTNGAEGEVQVGLDGPTVRGLTATLDRKSVPAHGTAVLTLKFDPADKSGPPDVWVPKGKIPYRLVIFPFNRMYGIDVVFTASK